jgi:hypothetical protein
MWRPAWRHGEALPALILHHRNAGGSNSAQAVWELSYRATGFNPLQSMPG